MNLSKRLTLLGLALAVVMVLAAWEPALAQCAMCKQSVEASTDATSLASSFNLAVLILLVPPVSIFAGVFGAIYKYLDDQGKDDQEE